jgi:hypothetical protein
MYFNAPLPFSAEDLAIASDGRTVAIVGSQGSGGKNVLWHYELEMRVTFGRGIGTADGSSSKRLPRHIRVHRSGLGRLLLTLSLRSFRRIDVESTLLEL